MRILVYLFAAILAFATTASAANNKITVNGKDLFISGTNVPWSNFANDFADAKLSESYFKEAIIKVREAGGNAIRVWVYTDCSYAPKFGSDGLVSSMGSNTINNVKSLLDIAEEYGVVVDLCLLSFDMMQHGITSEQKAGKAGWSTYNIDNNRKLMQTDEGIKAFIDNAVTPLVSADGIKGHPAIMCWEVFNEPEGMTQEYGWTGKDGKGEFVTIADVQKVVNRVAAAIKAVDPNVLVSNGSQQPKFTSANTTGKNHYSDAALKAAGGEATGVLDFYMIHYYAHWQGAEDSPFEQTAAYWELDKPVIIGEFAIYGIKASDAHSGVNGVNDVSIEQCYEGSYDKGYAGALSWQYPMFKSHEVDQKEGTFAESAPAMKALYDKYTDEIKIKDFTAPTNLGNCMQIEFDGLTNDPGASIKMEQSFDLSSSSSLKCRLKIPEGANNNGELQVQFVVKAGTGWTWYQAIDSKIFKVQSNATGWQEFEVKFSEMTKWDDKTANPDPTSVKSVLFKFLGDNFTGKVLIDDISSGSTVIADFNDGYGMWPVDEDSKSSIASITSVFDEGNVATSVQKASVIESVYPNPSTDIVNILLKSPKDLVEIRNLREELVYSKKDVDKHLSIDVTSWKKGVYYVFINGEFVRSIYIK